MVTPQIQELLQAGVHFGHQTRRWNPKMKPFIFTERNGIYIIDLNKTLDAIRVACQKVREIIARGQSILFVGTKKQAKDVIKDEALRCGQFYVTERWLGGMLTNFATIKGSIKKLKDMERMRDEGELEKFTKKERASFDHDIEKLTKVLGGIKGMNYLPGLVFVVDAKKEKIAVAEASNLGIPIIGLIDTNADPDPIDFPIAANDDAIKSIRIITKTIVDTVVDAQQTVSEEEIAESLEAKTADRLQAYTTSKRDEEA
ncbi:MAG: 30S ribosomal protein S2 [Candidatus Zixiibacteriota bacterium]|nr:MAG: 30S ribosomal protein S2 [candidate division Zixibacteria bacterium]